METRLALRELVATWDAVRGLAGRLEKRARMAALFAGLAPDDLRLAASYLAGEIPQGKLQVGWSTLNAATSRRARDLPLFRDTAPEVRPLTLADVDAAFEALRRAAGPGSERKRTGILSDLLERAGEDEREFLSRLLLEELRQGALRALVVEALADALTMAPEALRRALMFAGELPAVVEAAARGGEPALARFTLRPLVPIEPMLASTAESATEAFDTLGSAAVEWKLDGVRVQLHREGDSTRAFSRQLRDVSALVPELLQLGRQLVATSFVLDGEVIALDAGGRPVPFQDLMSRFSRGDDAAGRARREAPPLVVLFFDLLYLDGDPLVERPYRERRAALERLVPEQHRVPARLVGNADEAERAFRQALERGHEGVVVKALDSQYAAGRRGSQWLKVKPAVTLDLVILAAEWGHGRRRGVLSNLHLGARVPEESGRFAMLGKTFKGLTDAMLRELTTDLLAIETGREGIVVHVRPERVVEIAFDSVQRSRRYDSGLALRFARVKRFRPDKQATEATSIDEVRAIEARRRELGGS